MADKRKKRRFELRLPVEIRRTSDGTGVRGETINVSSSGVLFAADHHLPVGEVIEYFITFPTHSDSTRTVRLWCMGRILRADRELAFAASVDHCEFIASGDVSASVERMDAVK